MKYLVRINRANKDKQNESTNDLSIALKFLNKNESDVYKKVNWLHYTDLFFVGTENYIRVDNKL